MFKFKTELLAVAACVALSACASPEPAIEIDAAARLDTLAPSALSYAADQYLESATRLDPADGTPRRATDSTDWEFVSVNGWTSGFFAGILWQLADYTNDPELRAQAHRWTVPLERIFEGHYDHDLGFQFLLSYGQALEITGDEQYRGPLMEAASKLADRFNPTVGAIKSWDWSEDWRFPVIADNMMNLELLLWGAKNGGEEEWRDIAIAHARTTTRDHIRDDGGSFHVVVYDPETGAVESKITHQGAADMSTWARGQAWMIHGFTMMYRETGEEEFLDTARRLADYYVERLPQDGVPYWDFQAPGIPDTYRDASAGAIAASGLLELSTFTEGAEAARYRSTAERALATLAGPQYLTRGSENPAVLRHMVGHLPGGSEIDMSIIYGDFYFIEGLRRYLAM